MREPGAPRAGGGGAGWTARCSNAPPPAAARQAGPESLVGESAPGDRAGGREGPGYPFPYWRTSLPSSIMARACIMRAAAALGRPLSSATDSQQAPA